MFFTVSSSLPAPRLAADAPRLSFMLAFKLSKNSCKLPSFSSPSSVRLRVQKYYIFLYLQQLFSLFFKLFPFALNVSEIHFDFFGRHGVFGLNLGEKGRFRPVFKGRPQGLAEVFCCILMKSARFSRLSRRLPKAENSNPCGLLHATPYYIRN